ncbi:hypothetical protein FACS189450_13040 [Spirochaetia bacterium]|nr:hypothetical protein FACS189450_13040 [Spirochaetia bacterium]
MLKKAIGLFLLGVSLTGILFAQSENDFRVKQLPNGTVELTGYTGQGGDIVIPSKIYGIPVSIVDLQVYMYNVTSVVFSPGIKQAGVETQGLYSTTRDDQYRLTAVTLPNGLERIGEYAFEDHKLPAVVIPNTVKEIGSWAFQKCTLTDVSIPRSVTRIGDAAFRNNKISTVTLESVFDVFTGYSRQGVFAGNNIIAITMPANWPSNTLGALGFDQNFDNFYISQGKKAGAYIKKGQIWTLGTAQEFQQILSEVQKAEQQKVAREKRAAEIRAEEQRAAELRAEQESAERQMADEQRTQERIAIMQKEGEERRQSAFADRIRAIQREVTQLNALKKFDALQFQQLMNLDTKFREEHIRYPGNQDLEKIAASIDQLMKKLNKKQQTEAANGVTIRQATATKEAEEAIARENKQKAAEAQGRPVVAERLNHSRGSW